MANDQAEDGFVMIALPIFGALLGADLPNRCMIVMSEVLAQSYGHLKQRDVFLDPINFERLSGLHRNNARRAIRELVEWNFIKSNSNGSYRFVKDRDTWMPHGVPITDRLEGGIKRFAESLQGRFGIIKKKAKAPIQRDITSTITPIPLDCIGQQSQNPTGLSLTTVTESNGIVALKGTGANSELRSKNRDHHHADDDAVEFTDKNGEPLKPTVSNDPAEVVRVAKSTHTLLKRDFVSQVHSCAALFPIDWIERAIQDASTWPDLLSSFQPILNRLRRWQTAKPPGPPAIEATRKGYTATAGPIIPHADQSQPAEPPKVKLWATNSIHNPNRKPKTS